MKKQDAHPERQVSVFVSSVYAELKEYRQAALDGVWRCDLYPTGMERGDVAMPYSKYEASRRMVEEADVYVGIFAARYGEVTVEELGWARARGVPLLIFLAERQLNDDDVEPDADKRGKLAELEAALRDEYVAGMFTTAQELGDKVYRSLTRLQEEGAIPKAMAGAGRLDAIPTPPQPYYAHRYILSQSGFVGRRAELDALDTWARTPDLPLLVVDAIGGAGKSALAWEWSHTRLAHAFPQPHGTLWWSFYESEATIGAFLARALAYLTERPLKEFTGLLRAEREELLLSLLSARPVALVLDGLERLLVAYARLDGPQLTDAEVEQAPRTCVDPRDGAFLRALAQCAGSKILVTTRLVPDDLRDRDGILVTGVQVRELPGLSADDAMGLLEAAGIHGNHALMQGFLQEFGDHALLVKVLAGRIAAYHPAPGDFDAWFAAEGRHLELRQEDLVARRNSILAAGLAGLDPGVFRLLCQIAAFRYPVEYGALVALNPFAPSPGVEETTEEAAEQAAVRSAEGLVRLHAALSELEARGLVQWDRPGNRYDLHPVVRAYAYAHLEDRSGTYDRIRDYFERLPAEDQVQVRDVGDLRRTLEIYHALLGAGQLDAAFRFYRDRLGDLLLSALGAYRTMVEVLVPLFPAGLEQPPVLSSSMDQGNVANDLALAFLNLGELRSAQALHALSIRILIEQSDELNVAIALGNLAIDLQDSGSLALAERALLLQRELGQAAGNQGEVDGAQSYLTGLYAAMGAWAQSEAVYAALQASPEEPTTYRRGTPVRAAWLRFGQGQDPTPLLERALASARAVPDLLLERLARQLQGEVALDHGDLADAEVAWLAAHAIAQRQVIPEGPSLADLARLRARQGDAVRARQLIEEALRAGGVGPIDLAAAEVCLALGEREEAARHIEPAYRRAWADGPPYNFFFELRRARAVLAALGRPEPALPPFDPARVPPLPEEEGIRAFIARLEAERQEQEAEEAARQAEEDAAARRAADEAAAAQHAAEEAAAQRAAEEAAAAQRAAEEAAAAQRAADDAAKAKQRPWWRRLGRQRTT